MISHETTNKAGDELGRIAKLLLGGNIAGFERYCAELQEEDTELGFKEIKRPFHDLMSSYEIYSRKNIDPIDTKDWNVCVKWRDWCIENIDNDTSVRSGHVVFSQSIKRVVAFRTQWKYQNDIAISMVTSVDIIRAVCHCVIDSKGYKERCEK